MLVRSQPRFACQGEWQSGQRTRGEACGPQWTSEFDAEGDNQEPWAELKGFERGSRSQPQLDFGRHTGFAKHPIAIMSQQPLSAMPRAAKQRTGVDGSDPPRSAGSLGDATPFRNLTSMLAAQQQHTFGAGIASQEQPGVDPSNRTPGQQHAWDQTSASAQQQHAIQRFVAAQPASTPSAMAAHQQRALDPYSVAAQERHALERAAAAARQQRALEQCTLREPSRRNSTAMVYMQQQLLASPMDFCRAPATRTPPLGSDHGQSTGFRHSHSVGPQQHLQGLTRDPRHQQPSILNDLRYHLQRGSQDAQTSSDASLRIPELAQDLLDLDANELSMF